MSSPDGEPPLNGSDPANLQGFEDEFGKLPLPPTWVWAVVTIVLRYLMTEAALDRRSAGVLGLLFSTVTPAHLNRGTDPQWSCSLAKINPSHDELLFGENTTVPKWSIRRHSWYWFEYFVDCIAFKKHILLQKNIYGEDGIVREWLRWRERSPYLLLTGNKYQSSSVSTRCPSAGRGGGVAAKNLTLAYGDKEVQIPAGAQFEAKFWAERFDVCLSTIIRFILFGWGLGYCSTAAAFAVTAPFVILTLVFYFLCCQFPSPGQHWDFCQRISHDADRIHEAARTEFLTGSGRNTVDTILYLDDKSLWTWCRIGHNWISYEIPAEKAWAEYAFSILGLLAHTLLPIGWINETNILQNFFFALIAASLQHRYPTLGTFIGVLIGNILHLFGWQHPSPLWLATSYDW